MGVLGSILHDPRQYLPIVQQRVTDEHFYVPACRLMFNALLNFYEDHGQFDLVEFTTEMLQTGQDKNMGGPGFIAEVFSFVPIGANIDYYLGIVCDKYVARQVIKASNESLRLAYQHSDNAAYLLSEHEKHMEAVRISVGVGHLRLPDLCDLSKYLGENQLEEPPELVEGILHQGSKLIVGGTSKGRKTMTLTDLAVPVAIGGEWWGFRCVQGPVCYINFEIQDAFFAKRVQAVCSVKGVTLSAGMFHIWNLRGHGEG
jgi:hypothetical protein